MRDALEPLARSFFRSLRAQHKSPKTIETYGEAARQFIDFLEAPPAGDAAELLAERPVKTETDIERAHVEAFLGWLLTCRSVSTVLNRYTGLQQWFRWMVDQPDIDVTLSPMIGMKRPVLPEKELPVITVADLKAVLATCDARSYLGVRDRAIISLLCDTGIRLSECAGLMVEQSEDQKVQVPWLDLDHDEVTVWGKGRRWRTISFGARTSATLDTYLRVRRKHPLAYRPELWLSGQGRYKNPLTGSGIRQMLDKRSAEANVPHIHPHLCRHTWADAQKRAGLSKEDLKRQGGWKSDAMVERYGASEGNRRARDAHRRTSFMDKI